MSSTALWASVDAVLAEFDLLKHPFYTAWSRGELTHADLKFYGEQYVAHVAAFPTYLTALHARLPEGRMRKEVLANAAEEESTDRSHADIWRQFTAGMAAKAADAPGEAATIPALNGLVETFRQMAADASPVEAIAAFHAYESQVPRIADTKLDGLQKHYGADAETCEYFAIHKTADIYHSAVWRGLLEAELARDPAVAADILAGTRKSAAALWAALDGIEAVRTAASVH